MSEHVHRSKVAQGHLQRALWAVGEAHHQRRSDRGALSDDRTAARALRAGTPGGQLSAIEAAVFSSGSMPVRLPAVGQVPSSEEPATWWG